MSKIDYTYKYGKEFNKDQNGYNEKFMRDRKSQH